MYICEDCNPELGQAIAEEKQKRKKFKSKQLKMIGFGAINIAFLIILLFPLGVYALFSFIPLGIIISLILFFYKREINRRENVFKKTFLDLSELIDELDNQFRIWEEKEEKKR